MTPACPCKFSNRWFNTQLLGENFKIKDQRLPSCFFLLQNPPTSFYYILLLLLAALSLGKALWMGQCPNSVSESSKPGVAHMEPCWSWLRQHHMPGLHCNTRRQTLLEEEALENLRVDKGNAYMSHGQMVTGGTGQGWQVNKTRLKAAWRAIIPQAAHFYCSAPHFFHKC